jgi:hypothetical protein
VAQFHQGYVDITTAVNLKAVGDPHV